MKMYVVSAMDFRVETGYTGKILGQVKAFRKHGFNVELIAFQGRNIYKNIGDEKIIDSSIVGYLPRRYYLYIYVLIYLMKQDGGYIYNRHQGFNLISYICLAVLKVKYFIIGEIPTVSDGEVVNSIYNAAKIKLKNYYLSSAYNFIVTIGGETHLKNTRTMQINNGVYVDYFNIKKDRSSFNGDKLRLIAVANAQNYHGYDRIIIGIKRYNNKQQQLNVTLTIIGPDTPSNKDLKRLVKHHMLERYVKFVGVKSGLELDDAFDHHDFAISALAWHRVGVKTASNLKAREYCARGIPFVYAGYDPAFEEAGEFALKVNSDEKEINIQTLVEFYYAFSKKKISSIDIRGYAERRLGWDIMLVPVVDHVRRMNV